MHSVLITVLNITFIANLYFKNLKAEFEIAHVRQFNFMATESLQYMSDSATSWLLN
jgi:hypothetical protein